MFYRKSFQDQNVSVHKRVKKCLSASVSWKESLQSIHSLYKLTRITFVFLLGKPLFSVFLEKIHLYLGLILSIFRKK